MYLYLYNSVFLTGFFLVIVTGQLLLDELGLAIILTEQVPFAVLAVCVINCLFPGGDVLF